MYVRLLALGALGWKVSCFIKYLRYILLAPKKEQVKAGAVGANADNGVVASSVNSVMVDSTGDTQTISTPKTSSSFWIFCDISNHIALVLYTMLATWILILHNAHVHRAE